MLRVSQSDTVLGIANPICWILNTISSEKRLPDFNAFPVNLHWRQDSKVFPPAEFWLVNSNFRRASRMQECYVSSGWLSSLFSRFLSRFWLSIISIIVSFRKDSSVLTAARTAGSAAVCKVDVCLEGEQITFLRNISNKWKEKTFYIYSLDQLLSTLIKPWDKEQMLSLCRFTYKHFKRSYWKFRALGHIFLDNAGLKKW